MSVTVRTRVRALLPGAARTRVRRGIAVGAVVVAAAGIATGAAQVATAQPQPSITQVQTEVNQLTSKYDKASEQYDATASQLSQAKSRLTQVNKQMASRQKLYTSYRVKVVQIANASFEDSGQTSLAGLLTTGDPSRVLNEASMITQITGARNEEAKQFLNAAQALESVQQTQKRTEQGIAQLAAKQNAAKNQAEQAMNSEKAKLDSLTAAQQQAVAAKTLGGSTSTSTSSSSSGGTTTVTAPTGSGNAAKAVAFVLQMAADNCPYVYGATGPCSAGFDCSGLQQAAWAAAGVSIPRDTYEQWAALPHISSSDIQPGDLLYYDGEGHVAMYVGNNMIVDAPQTGEDVTERPMSESWYASNFDGAVRP